MVMMTLISSMLCYGDNENICAGITQELGRQHIRPSVDYDAGVRALSKVECLKTYRILMNNERADGDDIEKR